MKRDPCESLADWLPPEPGMRSLLAHRLDEASAVPVQEGCWVVEEQALRIEVQEVGHYTLMCTPTGPAQASGYLPQDGVLGDVREPGALALAAGFLFTEGLIDTLDQIASMAICPDSSSVVKVRLRDPACAHTARRSGLVASSCGLCGNVDEVVQGGAGVGDTLVLGAAQLQRCMHTMRQHQVLFARTGGTHAAALFGADGTLRALAEDLGRHNALDKVIGHCLLTGVPTAGGFVMLSGRVSLEMVTKAARAGLELVAAVSAPSSLAVDVARSAGITLCGFVRATRLTAFSHPHRLGA
ncbi:MAG: formate dehydrogenase accessory sulfurtransferase FdhD [Rhodoferax sp.]